MLHNLPKAFGQYLIRQLLASLPSILLNPLKALASYIIRQPEFDDGMTERLEETNKLLRNLIQGREEDRRELEEERKKDRREREEDRYLVRSISMLALSLLDAEINFDSVLVESRSDGNIKRSNFKKALHDAHGLPPGGRCSDFIAAKIIPKAPDNIHDSEVVSYDMATGSVLPSKYTIGSHIYAHRWKINLLTTFPPSITNDPRNGLILYKPVELAFDRAQVCIDVKVSTSGQPDLFTFRLLDESLRHQDLGEYAKELPGAPSIQQISFNTMFGDLDKRELRWPPTSQFRPSRRLLALHASIAAHKAWDWYGYKETQPFPYDVSGDMQALLGVNAFSKLRSKIP